MQCPSWQRVKPKIASWCHIEHFNHPYNGVLHPCHGGLHQLIGFQAGTAKAALFPQSQWPEGVWLSHVVKLAASHYRPPPSQICVKALCEGESDLCEGAEGSTPRLLRAGSVSPPFQAISFHSTPRSTRPCSNGRAACFQGTIVWEPPPFPSSAPLCRSSLPWLRTVLRPLRHRLAFLISPTAPQQCADRVGVLSSLPRLRTGLRPHLLALVCVSAFSLPQPRSNLWAL